jgi:hypothetical protein
VEGGEWEGRLSRTLAKGLQDNSCDVRFTASMACRSFMEALSADAREKAFPLLLPRICLNR